MKLDPAFAKDIADRLSHPYGRVDLLADGHRVVGSVQRISKTAIRYGVVVYVDGYMRGESMKPDSEIGAKFYPLRTRNFFNAKALVAHTKLFGKRDADKLRKRGEYQYRQPFFATGTAFVRHLVKTCSAIELAPAQEPA